MGWRDRAVIFMAPSIVGHRRTRRIPFSRPPVSAAGSAAVIDAVAGGQLKAGGSYTRRCERTLQDILGVPSVVLVQSCTAALELAAMLLGIGPGDEVVMPSFAFASAANAFVLRGAVPVFVDVQADTLNVDPRAVEAAITSRTRAIVAVHYAGIAADMDRLVALAQEHEIALVEDAAQGIGATHHGRPLGTIGTIGTISFDATKNVSSGSGGTLVVNDSRLLARAEALRDYGTDRARFVRGEVERYRWIDTGSNYALNELGAAYLWPQLEDLPQITAARRRAWQQYHDAFAGPEHAGALRRPVVPPECCANGHIYALVLPSEAQRDHLQAGLAEAGVQATFHYTPLHSSPAGQRHGRTSGSLAQTDDLSTRLLRLPLYPDMPDADVEYVVRAVLDRLAAAPAAR